MRTRAGQVAVSALLLSAAGDEPRASRQPLPRPSTSCTGRSSAASSRVILRSWPRSKRSCASVSSVRPELRQGQVRRGESPRSWQAPAMSPSTERQLRLIRRFGAVMEAAGLPFWLFGGWGLDARLGRITREHDDIEFWVEREQGGRSKSVLVEAGAVVLPTQPEEESREYTWDDVLFSTAYFDRRETARSNSKAGGRIGTFLSSPLARTPASSTAMRCRR